jgi:hypothetical protein
MFLLPYIHKVTTVNNITVNSYTILTIGGTKLWEETDTKELTKELYVKDILQQNDIFTESIEKKTDIYLCSVDINKTSVTDFYKWSEIPNADTFCWRTLYTFGANNAWLPYPNECIGTYTCESICQLLSI